MPRFGNPWEEAASQGILWNPLTLRPQVLLDPADESSLTMTTGSIVASIRNKGISGGSFSAPSKTAGQEVVKSRQFGKNWLYNPTSAAGFVSSYSDTWSLNNSNFRTVIGLQYPTAAAGVLNALSIAVTSTCTMNYGTNTTDEGWNHNNTSKAIINTAGQPLATNAPTIISHVCSNNSFFGRYSQGGSGNTANSTQTPNFTSQTRNAVLYAWGIATSTANAGYYGAIFYVFRKLTIFDIQRVEGWMAWKYGCPFVLQPNHPFKSRPPTN